MDLEEGRRVEEGDGAGDVWIWRRDEGWRKAMDQEMYGSGGGLKGGGRRWSMRCMDQEEG